MSEPVDIFGEILSGIISAIVDAIVGAVLSVLGLGGGAE